MPRSRKPLLLTAIRFGYNRATSARSPNYGRADRNSERTDDAKQDTVHARRP